jgi:hypothetical protein
VNNTSRKKTNNHLWYSIRQESLSGIMGKDWMCYSTAGTINKSNTQILPVDKKKVAVLITTCRPPDAVETILKKLEKEKDKYQLEFFVADDKILKNGKKNYWKTVNLLWSKVRDKDFHYYVHLPDDVSWDDCLIEKAIRNWENIQDPKKICLNLLLDRLRLGKTCWTNYWPVVKYFGQNRYLKTQWVDMIFICGEKFFQELNWMIDPISPSRWEVDPELSSGVGQQISWRLHQKNWNLYQVGQTLLQHTDNRSIMNPIVRARDPIVAAELPFIYAGMASIPDREDQMKKTISCIIPYVDRLFLLLNEYKEIPEWLSAYENITTYLGRRESFNMGDAGKFFGLNSIREKDFFYFTLDDDLVYPQDYIWKMIRKIEQFHRKAIVGCGGYIMKSQVSHFYKDRQISWHISMHNDKDRPVQILHTGISAWHSSVMDFQPGECKKANMSDLWLALAAQKNQVPRILIQRSANWIVGQPNPIEKTIYGRYRDNCQEQTEVYNSLHEWDLITM